MERVLFVESVKVRNDEGREFEAGKEYDLPAASARRWIIRGKAELVVSAGDAPMSPMESPAPPQTGKDASAKRAKK